VFFPTVWRESLDLFVGIYKTFNEGPYKPPIKIFDPKARKTYHVTPQTKLWTNVLINFPGISDEKVDLILKRFKTLDSLYAVYLDPTI
jgi:nitric oxide synthase oxygenase domain/subunit